MFLQPAGAWPIINDLLLLTLSNANACLYLLPREKTDPTVLRNVTFNFEIKTESYEFY